MLFQTSLGIDIEDSRVSMAYLKASFKGVGLAAYAIHLFEKEKPVEEKLGTVRGLVEDFLRENRISSTDIFLGIPRDLTIVRYIELPLAAKENLRETLGYEMGKYVPLSANDIYFDYQLLGEDKENGLLRVLLIVAKKNAIDPYLDLRNQLGRRISGVENGSTAMANYFSCKPNRPDGDVYALVYVRDDNLELNLVKERFLNYSRSVSTGDNEGNLNSLLLQELKSLRETLGEDHGPLETTFCGPDADNKLLNILREEADLDVRPVDLSGTRIPSYDLIPAYGLALKAIQKVPMDINLLPVELRKKASKVGYYAMFVLAGLLILSVLAWGGGSVLHQKLTLNRLNAEINRLSVEITKIDRVRKKCEKLESRIDYLNTLRGGRVHMMDILKDLSEKIPKSAWVRKLNFSDKGIQVEGHADSASELISLLEASPLFKDVAFLSPITKDRDGKERFRIGFQIN